LRVSAPFLTGGGASNGDSKTGKGFYNGSVEGGVQIDQSTTVKDLPASLEPIVKIHCYEIGNAGRVQIDHPTTFNISPARSVDYDFNAITREKRERSAAKADDAEVPSTCSTTQQFWWWTLMQRNS
jgi:hypothetical protein